MPTPLIPAWTRRKFAINLAATFIGAAVLVMLLALLSMLYRMNAFTPLPQPAEMLHPQTTAWLVVRVDGDQEARALPRGLDAEWVAETPAQVRNLVAKGLADPRCPVLFVASQFRTNRGDEPLVALSLGRYPGLFRIVRKDVARKVEKGLIPFQALGERTPTVYWRSETPGEEPAGAFALTERSVVQSSSAMAVARIVGGQGTSGWVYDQWQPPPPFEALSFPNPRFRAGAFSWAALRSPMLVHLPAMARWNALANQLEADFPSIRPARSFLARGQFDGPKALTGSLSFVMESEDAAQALADALPGWIEAHARPLGVSASNIRALERGVFMDIRVDFEE